MTDTNAFSVEKHSARGFETKPRADLLLWAVISAVYLAAE